MSQYPSSSRLRTWLAWVGRNEPIVLIALLLMATSLWTVIAVADAVEEGNTHAFDTWALRALRDAENPSQPIGPHWLPEVARDITALGGFAVLTLVTLAVAGFLWLRKALAGMALVLLAAGGGALMSLLLKQFFDRPRPDVVPHLSVVSSSSFPSGHAMLSAVVYLTLGALLGRFVTPWRLRAYVLLVAVSVTLLVGVSRVYLGVHYPSDVIAGWAAGLAWALGCWLVARWLQRKGAVEGATTDADAKQTPHQGRQSDGR